MRKDVKWSCNTQIGILLTVRLAHRIFASALIAVRHSRVSGHCSGLMVMERDLDCHIIITIWKA